MVETTAVRIPTAVLLALAIFLLLLSGQTAAQEKNLEKSFPNVVMIDAAIAGAPGFGAGIVVGSRAGRIYIATANHVVRKGREEATDIKVRFHFLPGEKFNAKLLDHYNKDLDVAILSVNAGGGQVPESELNYTILGKSGDLNRGSDVHPLGNPGSKAWGVALNPEKVDKRKTTEIVFQSSFIQGGHSGGALLNACGDIVGLIVRDSAPNGEAVRFEAVLDLLNLWNYPVSLQETSGCASTEPNAQTPSRPAGDFQVVEENDDFPVELNLGKSRIFRITKAQSAGAFMFTPSVSSAYNVSVVSNPSRVDLGWMIVDNSANNETVVTCDNDSPTRGIEACVTSLQGGMPYYLLVTNLTGDESGEAAEPVDFSITIARDNTTSYPTVIANAGDDPAEATGDIMIRYTGDQGGCNILIQIAFEYDEIMVEPPSSYFPVENLTLGEDSYHIAGSIQCPAWGTDCLVVSTGEINIEDGRTYDIVWQDQGTGYCAMELR